MLTAIKSVYDHVRSYLEDIGEAVMPQLYLLKRGLGSIRSADDHMIFFNSPTNDGRSATVNGIHVTLEGMKRVQDELVEDIEGRLDDLLWGSFRISDDIEIHDEPRELQAGYSFATDRGNPWNQESSVLKYLITDSERLAAFAHIDERGDVIWHPGACMKRMREIYQLQSLILIAIILTAGEPARGTEYAAMLFSNIAAGSIRNVFWLLGVLMFRGSYNKTSHTSGEDKTMVRVPLPKLGLLIVRFLVYLRPLYAEWQYHFRPALYSNAQSFLLAGLYRPVTAGDITIALAKYTEEHLGVRMTIRVFRQYMAYTTQWYPQLFNAIELPTTSAAKQLGHTSKVDRNNYGADGELPAGLPRYALMETAQVSAVIHMIFGHPPTLLRMLHRGTAAVALLERTILSITRPDISSIAQISCAPPVPSATPSVQVIDMIAEAVSGRIIPELDARNRQALVHAHASVLDLFYPFKPSANTITKKPSDNIFPHPYVLRMLREFVGCKEGDTLGFKNREQGIVTQLMIENKRHVMYVAPTGKHL
jgi:hypothetical protein